MSGLTIQTAAAGPTTRDPFLHHICSELTYEELATKVSLVCKTWKEWADSFFNAKELSQLNVRVFSRYGIEEELKRALRPEDFAQLSFEMIPHKIDVKKALIKAEMFYAGIRSAGTAVEGDEGLFIVPRPEGLTLGMFRRAYRDRFRYFEFQVLREDKLLDKKSEGGQFMITSNILEKTRGESFEDQQSLCQKAGGDLPEVLNAVFYAIMIEKFTEKAGSYTRSGDKLFGNDHTFSKQSTYAINPFSKGTGHHSFYSRNGDLWTFTRCLEKIQERPWSERPSSITVGGFGVGCGDDSDGLNLNLDANELERDVHVGAAALQKF